MTFRDLKLHESVLEGLDSMGFENPTPVQEQAIPVIVSGKDIIASAQTGTGKTGAFLLPIIHRILSQPQSKGINTLILAPTRELAMQIDQQVEGFSYFCGISNIAIYGGSGAQDFGQEKRALSQGADIVVATPGRLISHLNLGYVKTQDLQHLILDEADRMLDMGFYDDLVKIISHLPKSRQSLMFSATFPPKIRQLAKTVCKEPEEISIAISKTAEGVEQKAYICYDNQKLGIIKSILKAQDLPSVIIFCSRKSETSELARELKRTGLNVKAFHSGLEQSEREETIRAFKSRKLQILVATDILSRGIDIEDISMVINHRVPKDGEDYVHRVGRTARAASTGQAITLVNEEDQYSFHKIEELIGLEIPKLSPPEELGEGPEYRGGERRKGGGGKGRGGKKPHGGGNRQGGGGGRKPQGNRNRKPRGNRQEASSGQGQSKPQGQRLDKPKEGQKPSGKYRQRRNPNQGQQGE